MRRSTCGFLWTWTPGLRQALEAALRSEGYRLWTQALSPGYRSQEWEVIRLNWVEPNSGERVKMTPAKNIHHWGLQASQCTSLPVLTTYKEPGEHWIAKCFASGRPLWKSRPGLDLEVPYPIPILNAERATSMQPHLHQPLADWTDSTLTSWSHFHGFWGIDEQETNEPITQSIWLQRDSPLWSNNTEENV